MNSDSALAREDSMFSNDLLSSIQMKDGTKAIIVTTALKKQPIAIRRQKAENMDIAFNRNFLIKHSIIDQPEVQVNEYLTKKMSLYLNKALHKL